ncbi:hypothetical protein [Acetivibrio cellulolyticus]|uniref:hypothetical protein n=1 Tax=Acetivibrio cellulolyticus TaxID=35830 RepID=UPI0001E2E300|nr:hypothetical protein [Acetivibrio cellulolyticus]
MIGVLERHKGLILFISLVIISLFLLIVYLMPKSSKIPSKGVFVLETKYHLIFDGGINAEDFN